MDSETESFFNFTIYTSKTSLPPAKRRSSPPKNIKAYFQRQIKAERGIYIHLARIKFCLELGLLHLTNPEPLITYLKILRC